MKLIFVYNIDGNLFSLIAGTAHKITSPDTYQCNLCKLTYPIAFMDKKWRKFISSLPLQTLFLHRDEFYKQYPNQKNIILPAVFIEDNLEIRLLISKEKISEAKNISELIEITKTSLQEKI